MNRTLQSISRLATQSRGALEWTGGLATASVSSEATQSLSQNNRTYSHIRSQCNRWVNGQWQCEKKCHGGVYKRWGSTSGGGPGQPKGPSSNPVSYTSLGLTMLTGAGLWWYFKSVEKQRMEKIAQKGAKNAVVAGKADIGGDFELIDSRNGKTFHSDALKGGFSLLYFGFTHCPDVCPDELEKIASAIDLVDKEMKGSTFKPVTPVFITLDPERDGVKQVAAYVKEFHPRMIGLTGSTESITKVTKSYRVYFTKAGVGEMTNNTSNTKDDDYLIDHSIITYLLDPKGEFVTFYGKNYTDRAMADSMLSIIKSYSG